MLCGQVLDVVSSARYLGMDISSNLNWNTHVNRVAVSANWSLGFIKRNVKISCPLCNVKTVPKIPRNGTQNNPASAVWDLHTKEQSHKIMVQRSAVRRAMNDWNRTTNVTSLPHHLDWQTLEEIRSVAPLFFCKVVYGILAVPLSY